MKKLMVCLLFLCGCRSTVAVDPLVGLPSLPTPVVVMPTLPALKIVEEPMYLPPSVTLGHPVPIEPEPKYLPLPVMPRPELPPLPPLPPFDL